MRSFGNTFQLRPKKHAPAGEGRGRRRVQAWQRRQVTGFQFNMRRCIMEQRAHAAPSSKTTPPCKFCATKHFTVWREHLTALKCEVYRRRQRAAKTTTAHQTFCRIVVHTPSRWSRGRRSTSSNCGGSSTCIFSEGQEAHHGSVTQRSAAGTAWRPSRQSCATAPHRERKKVHEQAAPFWPLVTAAPESLQAQRTPTNITQTYKLPQARRGAAQNGLPEASCGRG